MSTNESNEQMEYIIGEVMNRLNDIFRTSIFIILAALTVLIVSFLYLLRPFYQFRTSAPMTQVRSCPCFETILSNENSFKAVTRSILKDNDLDIKPREMANDCIKVNSNIEKEAEKVTTSKDSCQGPSEYHVDEDFLREIGLAECFKLPHLKEVQN
ncbi:PREDICTED: uncharacterized protein LOC106118916 [Papilio xuthus]|uniref:Uncharacterized protein LOC106118916 n=1 Tax=Papilio xuthus TaxID=66420 RepID=A0AAJ6ZBJ5_PAPXU|nr:PREDICTED: uncharacterized protein LOC106118916 [Papilio xuthus]